MKLTIFERIEDDKIRGVISLKKSWKPSIFARESATQLRVYARIIEMGFSRTLFFGSTNLLNRIERRIPHFNPHECLVAEGKELSISGQKRSFPAIDFFASFASRRPSENIEEFAYLASPRRTWLAHDVKLTDVIICFIFHVSHRDVGLALRSRLLITLLSSVSLSLSTGWWWLRWVTH